MINKLDVFLFARAAQLSAKHDSGGVRKEIVY